MTTTSRAVMISLAVASLCAPANAAADVIGPGDFVSPVLIDFSDAPPTAITGFYSGRGVTFSHLCGGAATGFGATGVNFVNGADTRCEGSNGSDFWPDIEATFGSPMDRAGFQILTNQSDDTVVSAFLDANLVGTEFFTTGNAFTFAGLQFLSPFNRLVIDVNGVNGGAAIIDDFRFEAASVPEPAMLMLMGAAGAGLVRHVRRRRTRTSR